MPLVVLELRATDMPAPSPAQRDSGAESSFPAYGPVDAALGYMMFYLFIDRASPTLVEVTTIALPDVSPTLVRLGLGGILWFIFAITLFVQLRRQLAALGVGRREDHTQTDRSGGTLSTPHRRLYLWILALGGIVSVWTFEPAIRAVITVIRIVGTPEITRFPFLEILLLAGFFIAFAGASRALDRLFIGSLRRLLSEGG